ncbi:class I SAM-dependent methyltransferase [Aeromicrobium fastidiosum]|uniref:O-methyltransferase n=1 Tax=Aeromicrobium TaxID=2040 RepID=UPI001781E011|nr:class I SAM-dependent methyltransferase [Aeromicrobium fastidiosum]MBD8606363.1 class I SAM-dependent methyltransferase [Aeromicrobium sp. CFBP 8757]MCL8250643.1 class I SAM-dependent methyltransferase [Aeromicrobium fastidiosum]
MTEAVPPAPRPVTPTTILARELDEIADRLGDGVPADVVARLRRARDLAGGLDPYLDRCTSPESADLAELARRTREAPWASREVVSGSGPLEQEMLSGHVEGRFLAFLVRMLRARRVLEIGMFTGYSALAIAEALPEGGEVVACEVDPYVAGLAREWLDLSPAGAAVTIEVGPAVETLDRLEGAFDLVFVDADKTGYAEYYRRLLDSDLLAPGAVVAVDNTLLQGQPWADDPTANGAAVARFNQLVADDPRVEQVLVPLRDGVTLIRRV